MKSKAERIADTITGAILSALSAVSVGVVGHGLTVEHTTGEAIAGGLTVLVCLGITSVFFVSIIISD